MLYDRYVRTYRFNPSPLSGRRRVVERGEVLENATRGVIGEKSHRVGDDM